MPTCRELRQRRAGGVTVLRQLRRAVRAGRSADRAHRRDRQDDADLSELRQRGARGLAVLRELRRAVSPTDRPAGQAASLTSETRRSSPAWSRRRRSTRLRPLRQPGSAACAGSRWEPSSCCSWPGVRSPPCSCGTTEGHDEAADHGTATTANRHLRAARRPSSPTLAETVAPRLRAALRLAGCARSLRSACSGRGWHSLAAVAAGGRGARLRPGGDATGRRRSRSGRRRGRGCARADASRARGPSRLRGGASPASPLCRGPSPARRRRGRSHWPRRRGVPT